jgi:uncharacterized delta-60 repeat protein
MANIDDILSSLNSNYEQITDLIPDKQIFVDDFDSAKNEYGQSYNNDPLGNQLFLLDSGKYIWVGIDGANNSCKNIRRYNSDFTLDETFEGPDFDSDENGFVRGVGEQSNGKIIAIGNFTLANGNSYGRIIRLNTDGSIDSTFNSSGVGFNDDALVVKVLSDDTILVGGSFNQYNEVNVNRLVKLNSNGSLDETFSGNISFNSHVHAICVDGSSKIYVGGEFSNAIVRLNSDGTTDGAFDVGVGFNNRVSSIALDSNGKIIVGGWFDEYKGSSCNPRIVRLETNGDLDSGFTTEGSGLNSPNGSVQCVVVQSNDKVIAGGWFNQYDGNRQGHIIRFNTDGTKDTTFAVDYGFGDEGDWNGVRIQNILLNDNKVLCVGNMQYYNGSPLYGFASLSSTASLNVERLFKYETYGISDGWDDMYDGGNFINTNLTQLFEDIQGDNVDEFSSIPNTHSVAMDENVFEDLYNDESITYDPPMNGKVMPGDDYFGSGSYYFTNMYPGMFTLVATNMKIEEFSIGGDVGSDGSTQNQSSMIILHEGATYTVFVKVNREGDGGESGNDPSVNHIIIVPCGSDGLSQTINEDGDDYDDDCIRGLSGRGSIAYILVARQNSEYLSDSSAQQIASKFLDVIGGLSSGASNLEFDVSPDNPETIPNYRFDGEGNMDTSIITDPVTGKRVSIQRTGYLELTDGCGNRKVVAVKDGENFGSTPKTWLDAISSIIKTSEPVMTNDIRILINSTYVDYQVDGGEGQEPNNLLALMDSLSIAYTTFTDISEESFASFAGGKILIPELEQDDLNPDLTSGARDAIATFVSNGGEIIVFNPDSGDTINVLNDTFGFSLNTNGVNEPISLTEAGSVLFPSESSTITYNDGTSSLDTTTLPPDSVTIYSGDGSDQSLVTMIPYGSGKIYVMGWDWFSAAPVSSQDGGWIHLLESILNS